MFLVESEGEQMGMKAMNCPGHMLVFGSQVRSYRDLPIRLHEQTPLHRNEASGVLSGLTRVRQFSQDDAHCFVTQEQIGEEVERLLGLVQRVYGDFGLQYEAKLSTSRKSSWRDCHVGLGRSPAEGRVGTRRTEVHAQRGRRGVLRAEDRLRRHRCDRPQVAVRHDSARLPAAGPFGLKYIGADNAEHMPIVIHRAIFGSFERFIAILIEHFAGAFPLWLAPVQAVVLPIADRHLDYARRVLEELRTAGLRVDLDERQEKIGYKIREAQLQKVPYMLVVGDREAAEGTVSVRTRTGGDQGAATISAFVDAAREEVASRGRNVADVGVAGASA
jgi:threonyl-tRNA synthetase